MNMKDNGTPYTDEQWKAWYANESSSERFEREQAKAEQDAHESEYQQQYEDQGRYEAEQEADAQAEYEQQQGPEGE